MAERARDMTPISPKKRKETMQQFRRRMREQLKLGRKTGDELYDVYRKAAISFDATRQPTGFVCDDIMLLHANEFDDRHPESPHRYNAIMHRLNELNLLERVRRIDITKGTNADILAVHTLEHYLKLKEISDLGDVEAYESQAEQYDSVYFNMGTFEAAITAAGGVKTLCEAICKGLIHNGLAVVRPPGHHAMENEYNGYCFFNNVAIAAQVMVQQELARKVLIVDYDVHHGQGIQENFYETDKVLYFSIHRYEHGQFWPNRRDGNFTYIGQEAGKGYNINVPLNSINCEDKDYMAIVLQLLLPIAYEYQPDLIIVSAGYDACIGCPEGEMKVTPGFYGHLIKLLSGLAYGRIAVCLEGGYFLPSLAEGVAMTLKALLDDPVATLDNITEPMEAVTEVINNVKCVLRPYWHCFQDVQSFGDGIDHTFTLNIYEGVPQTPPYPTRDCYPKKSEDDLALHEAIIESLKQEYQSLPKTKKVGYTYDAELLTHRTAAGFWENPVRLETLMKVFTDYNLHERCQEIKGAYAKEDDIRRIHSHSYAMRLYRHIEQLIQGKRDLYVNEHTLKCALKSAGSLIQLVDAVMKGELGSGAAFIRPPGHHADCNAAGGFCFVNNVAVAAAHLLDVHKLKRILIVDFDVHHGNGTQNIFYQTPEVLYISIHRYDNGNFYPFSEEGDYDKFGSIRGVGYNINIPFNDDKMGDMEYITAFFRIILPVAYEFNPEMVLVSAGFDAGINDPLGQYKLTPEVFGHFISLLKPLANGRLVLALEGGYNRTTTAFSMTICVSTLLGDALPKLDDYDSIYASAAKSIDTVVDAQKQFWPSLRVHKKLPDSQNIEEILRDFIE